MIGRANHIRKNGGKIHSMLNVVIDFCERKLRLLLFKLTRERIFKMKKATLVTSGSSISFLIKVNLHLFHIDPNSPSAI